MVIHKEGLGVAEPRLCLDFINTEGIERNSPPDRLESVELFLGWAADRGLIDEDSARSLAGAEPSKADNFLATARELREALYRTFAALLSEDEPEAADLAILGRHLSEALPHLHLAHDAGAFDWRLARPEGLVQLLWPIALSATDLLRSEQLARVKECAGETCSWMFIDGSRNRSRRWCDMADCGNRAKARRFYRRHAGQA